MKGAYDPKPLESCNPLATDLIARLLDRNPATRISAHEALEHGFLKDSSIQDKTAKGDEPVSCGCFGIRLGKTQAFRDPSTHSQRYTGAITPSTVDCSVRAGPDKGYASNAGFNEILRSDYAHMRAR